MKKFLQIISFSYNSNMSTPDRSFRLIAGLTQPVLSLTGVIDGKWEIFLEIFSVVLIITGISGKCFLYHLTGVCSRKTEAVANPAEGVKENQQA